MSEQAGIDKAASEWFTRRRLNLSANLRSDHATEAMATDEQAEFLAWMQTDARHQEAYQLMERTFDDVLWAIPNSNFGERTRRLNWRHWVYALVAGAACLAAATVMIQTPDVRLESTPVGQTREIALSDGSQITLSGRSSVEIRYSLLARRVTLKSGEAFFDVKHNALRPFHVNAGNLVVRDIGTRFDVNLRPASLEVEVLEGEVAVAYAKGEKPAARTKRDTQLVAGDNLRVATDEKGHATETDWVIRHETSYTDKASPWSEGRMVYDNAPLGDIVADLNRYYGPGIVIQNQALSDKRLTTSFAISDIDTFLNTLPVAANVSLQRKPNGTVVILQRNIDETNKS
ncbi:MAG: FecR domain-containing protein [Asticcacaulis sp.]